MRLNVLKNWIYQRSETLNSNSIEIDLRSKIKEIHFPTDDSFSLDRVV